MPSPVQIAVTPPRLHVMPGGKVTCSVVVRNIGDTDRRFRVAVRGVPTDWYILSSSVVELAPGETARLPLILNPPPMAAAATTDHTITVEARSEDDPAIAESAETVLTVSGAGALSMAVAPSTATGRRGAFAVTFTNESDSPATVSVVARDRGMRLAYRITPPRAITVPARGSAAVRVTARPLAPATLEDRHDFLIEFTGVRRERQTDLASSSLIQEARFTYTRSAFRGIPLPVRLLVAALVCAALAFAVIHALNGRTTPRTATIHARATPVPAVHAQGTQGARTGPSPTATILPSPTASPQSPPSVDVLNLRLQSPAKAQVQWAVRGARAVQIDGRFVSLTGQAAFPVPTQGRLLFSASNDAGTIARVLAIVQATPVRVIRELPARQVAPPVIEQFTVRQSKGSAGLALVWRVHGADVVLLNGARVAPVSGQPIQVGSVRAYRLQAINAAGRDTTALTLPGLPAVVTTKVVLHRPEIVRFALVHVSNGSPYTLVWQTTYARLVMLNNRTVPAAGSLPLFAPVRTATYLLMAQSITGTATAIVQVHVQ